MSRNSKSINILKESMNNFSGLDGQIGIVMENLIPIIKSIENDKRIDMKDIDKFIYECNRYNKMFNEWE